MLYNLIAKHQIKIPNSDSRKTSSNPDIFLFLTDFFYIWSVKKKTKNPNMINQKKFDRLEETNKEALAGGGEVVNLVKKVLGVGGHRLGWGLFGGPEAGQKLAAGQRIELRDKLADQVEQFTAAEAGQGPGQAMP